jgi:hypothetical protein
MTRSDQESPVPEIGTPGLMRRGLETGRRVPRQSATLLQTAKVLVLTMPQSMLARADEIIPVRDWMAAGAATPNCGMQPSARGRG